MNELYSIQKLTSNLGGIEAYLSGIELWLAGHEAILAADYLGELKEIREVIELIRKENQDERVCQYLAILLYYLMNELINAIDSEVTTDDTSFSRKEVV